MNSVVVVMARKSEIDSLADSDVKCMRKRASSPPHRGEPPILTRQWQMSIMHVVYILVTLVVVVVVCQKRSALKCMQMSRKGAFLADVYMREKRGASSHMYYCTM